MPPALAGVDPFRPGTTHHITRLQASPAAKAEREPGDRMADGSIYAGISPDTGKPMSTTPADAPLTMRWKDATEYAAKLAAHGHDDWRVPTKNELIVLHNNRAAIGGFNVSGSTAAGWYWSSSQNDSGGVWGQRLSDRRGYDDVNGLLTVWSLRCVR